MSVRLDSLGARKALLVAQLRLQRMELALHAQDLRDAARPAKMLGGSFAKPAAAAAVFGVVAPLFGLRKLAYWVRLGSIGFALSRIVRNW